MNLTLPVSAKYSDIVLRDNEGALAIWHIAITKYVIIASIAF